MMMTVVSMMMVTVVSMMMKVIRNEVIMLLSPVEFTWHLELGSLSNSETQTL